MKSIKLIVAIIFLGCSTILVAQTYVSPQQKMTTNGFTDRVETKLIKKVVIDGNNFSAELPDGGILSGFIELFRTVEREGEKRLVYKIAAGGILSINDDIADDKWDCIVLNLLSTPIKKVYTFWLIEGHKGDD